MDIQGVDVRIFSTILGAVIILIILWDGFETMVLPRRVTGRIRLARIFYRSAWIFWSAMVSRLLPARRQESFLSVYGPLSLILLLCVWAGGLVLGFSLLYWSTGPAIRDPEGTATIGTALYFSGSTFFTLGQGDATPLSQLARVLTVFEAGMGFGFLAVLIGHLPSLNQSFSSRETNITLLDARAGSPPSALEIMRRHCHEGGIEDLRRLLHEWEECASELLESHLSYPVLALYRSQHDNQSWLAALTAIMDTCALIMAGIQGSCVRQARSTFAMARHTVVDLAYIFKTPPRELPADRLPDAGMEFMRKELAAMGMRPRERGAMGRELAALRRMYEPYVYSMSLYLHLSLPPWAPAEDAIDNWRKSAWDVPPAGQASGKKSGRHF
jgi:hypothetical protein